MDTPHSDRDETDSILSSPELVSAIEAGLADAATGRVVTHAEIVADHLARMRADQRQR